MAVVMARMRLTARGRAKGRGMGRGPKDSLW
jgi:hypothetical protein